MTLARVRRPTCEARAAAWKASPQYVHAAVEVKNNVARFDSADGDLGGWDAAQCGCGHGHLDGQRLRRQQLTEQSPLLVDIAADGEG